MQFTSKEDLARFAIEYFLTYKKIPEVKKEEVDEKLWEKAACFATIYVDDKLRGCIGHYVATEPLYLNIIKNAINTAFSDPRFPSIQKDELAKLKLQISVLTPLKEFKPKNTNHLLQFLEKEKPGLMIEDQNRKALFLPQVWEKFETPSDFLSNLCLKAGLLSSYWQKEDVRYWIFYVS